MAELPVLSMAMLTAYVFYRFTETERPGYLYATAILFSFTVWTKQTAVFVACGSCSMLDLKATF
jgi:predicted membrane-bound mannosyltransferase